MLEPPNHLTALSDHDLASLGELLERWSAKPAHAAGILRSFYQSHGEPSLDQRTFGKSLVDRIARELPLRQSHIIQRLTSSDQTVKLLVGFAAGGSAETVLMPSYDPRRAAGCVSSQIGCAMGCDFCASTRGGLERNLSSGEIVEQFLHLRKVAAETNRRLNSLVFMGMGEPMHNLDSVAGAVARISSPGMGALGPRHITVSTVGIVPGIHRLAELGLSVHLALSLHAPDDNTRAQLVPMNRRWKVADIVAAARAFQDRTRRIVTIEYCMLNGVNDRDEQARQLADLVAGWRAHVNLIPYNAIGAGVSGAVYERPSAERVAAFLAILTQLGVIAHVRRTRGDDVAAACGQLRQQAMQPTLDAFSTEIPVSLNLNHKSGV